MIVGVKDMSMSDMLEAVIEQLREIIDIRGIKVV